MTYEMLLMLSEFDARGGSVTRVPQGKRGYSRACMREIIGDDDKRASALAREDYRKARKAERRKARAAKRAAREFVS